MADFPKLVKVTSDDWTALFDVDSDRLLVVGDSYLAEDRIDSIFGIEEIHSDAFLDPDGHCTITKYSEYLDREAAKRDRLAEAAARRAEAERLIAQAEALEARQ